MFVCLFIYVSVCVSVCLSVYMSIYLMSIYSLFSKNGLSCVYNTIMMTEDCQFNLAHRAELK